MNGAEYIAEFLHQHAVRHVFLMTGGACAFMVDAIARHPHLDYVAMQHEQAAAMAADAVWRTTGTLGAAMGTSGPGATNLLTGIACAYFDSIPVIYITGQVNLVEAEVMTGARPRQRGFQETDIVAMAQPITKYAVQVQSAEALSRELATAYRMAMTGRKGPVLIDVPMHVQKQTMSMVPERVTLSITAPESSLLKQARRQIAAFLESAERPLVLLGAGVGLAGVATEVNAWLHAKEVPFVCSWNGAGYANQQLANYYGTIGVYGNRNANILLQNADALLVLGSRLDNRQRSAHPEGFAPKARVMVVDVDAEELKKYAPYGYETLCLDAAFLPELLPESVPIAASWTRYGTELRETFSAGHLGDIMPDTSYLSPYAAVEKLSALVDKDASIIGDTGATLCWLYQMFKRRNQTLFTAGGMSPMGYALPAAIGAAMHSSRQVICCIGDGGLQVNLQELQTLVHHRLPIKIFLFNNGGYGIIKQFQDSYCEGRYEATGRGYSAPDFAKIAQAYGIGYARIERLEQFTADLLIQDGAMIIDLQLHPETLIAPKLEMGRPLHDQFPYLDRETFRKWNLYVEANA